MQFGLQICFLFFLTIMHLTTALDLGKKEHCYDTGNFTSNSTYAKNLNLILSSLASNVSENGGFYTVTVGQYPFKVYTLALCRGDSPPASCASCVDSAIQSLKTECPNQTDAISWGADADPPCIVRYAKRSVYGILELDLMYTGGSGNIRNIITNSTQFDQTWESLMGRIVIKASSGSSRLKFATEEAKVTSFRKIYALMQCTPDLSKSDCATCLRRSVDQFRSCCRGVQEGYVHTPNCIFSWDLSPFYNETADAPLPSPPTVNSPRAVISQLTVNSPRTFIAQQPSSPTDNSPSTVIAQQSSPPTENSPSTVIPQLPSLPTENSPPTVTSQLESNKEIYYANLTRNSSRASPPNVNNSPLPSPPIVNNATVPSPPIFNNSPLPSPPIVKNSPLPSPPIVNNYPLPSPPIVKNSPLPSPPIVNNSTLPSPPIFNNSPLPSPPQVTNPTSTIDSGKNESRTWIVIATTASAIIVLVLSSSLLWRIKRREERAKEKKANSREVLLLRLREGTIGNDYTYDDLRGQNQAESQAFPLFPLHLTVKATQNFSDENKLGEGGFGPVYKGILADGKEIAVKRLSRTSGQGLIEFKNEVTVIAKLQHKNLVRLLGCCLEDNESLLIYEYMPNKSLDVFLFDSKKSVQLDWKRRISIINGIARGLLYLHEDSRLKIIHRDLKASNVLLDHEMNPKISDFGMARIFGGNQSEANTNRVVGTYGYMAPEYAMEGLFSVKSDVFSFGVLLLEIISGKKNSGFYLSEHGQSLLSYTWKLWCEGDALELMDPVIKQSCVPAELLKCMHIGLLCVQEDSADRPTMSSVVVMLASDARTLPQPTEPAFSVGRIVANPCQFSPDATVNMVTLSDMSPR